MPLHARADPPKYVRGDIGAHGDAKAHRATARGDSAARVSRGRLFTVAPETYERRRRNKA